MRPTLAGLGRCALAADPASAQATLTLAAEIFQLLGAPEATTVVAELTTLGTAGSRLPTPWWCNTAREWLAGAV